MIKLKKLMRLDEALHNKMPDPSLAKYLLSEKVVSFGDYLYHGTPVEGLRSMLVDGISGTQHGEIAEYESFSTSINSEVLHLFSEGDGTTGLGFKVHGIKLLILDDIMHYLLINLPGSGMDIDVDKNDLETFCEQYGIPVNVRGPYLPYGYLSSLGVDAFIYKYTWDRSNHGYTGGDNDESEVCFIGKGISNLDHMIYQIYINEEEFEPSDKKAAIKYIDENL